MGEDEPDKEWAAGIWELRLVFMATDYWFLITDHLPLATDDWLPATDD